MIARICTGYRTTICDGAWEPFRLHTLSLVTVVMVLLTVCVIEGQPYGMPSVTKIGELGS